MIKYFEQTLDTRITDAMSQAGFSNEVFEFFWETKSPFSQWHKSYFSAKPLFSNASFNGDISFSSAEQFMMLHKALLFNDMGTANKIMASHNVREQKMLGRQIEKFDALQWDTVKVMVVYEGNRNKFQQNPDLQQALISTSGKTLVEAAPDDNVWGIGLRSNDSRALERATWQGSNFLGKVLTGLRISISGFY